MPRSGCEEARYDTSQQHDNQLRGQRLGQGKLGIILGYRLTP